jgi:FkbM family methyltransferase
MTVPARRKLAGMIGRPFIFYSGAGEDIVAASWLRSCGIELSRVRYLDIGAADPVELSNTYLFYRFGASGVLVEPDPRHAARIKSLRPRDLHLAVGAAFDGQRTAQLTRTSNPVFNSFRADLARRAVDQSTRWAPGQQLTLASPIDVPLRSVNDILGEHFGEPPHFLSIDADGVNFEIFASIDFDRFAPLLLCVERQRPIEDHLAVLGRGRYELIYQNGDNLMFRRF